MTNVTDAKLWQGLSISSAASHLEAAHSPGTDQDTLEQPGESLPGAASTTAAKLSEPGKSSLQFRHIASAELAQRATADARILAVATAIDANLVRPWISMPQRILHVDSGIPQALQWCAALALEGGRPFIFLSLQELQASFAQLRQEICLKRARVTMIVEPHPKSHDDEVVSTAGLVGIRQLPHLTVMSPKDDAELRQMVAWCETHEGPVLIWLPCAAQHGSGSNQGLPIEFGRAEWLGDGGQVTIIAWGPMVAAATRAAAWMAGLGIDATVVNARFGQPLDRETITRAVQGSLCTVLVDDADDCGGLSSWVLHHLRSIRITQPVTTVAPQSRSLQQNPSDVLDQVAMSIIDQCRWLVEPVDGVSDARIGSILRAETTRGQAISTWHESCQAAMSDKHGDQGQVLTQQFSPFIEHWVTEYEKVGARDLYLWRWCLHGLNLTTLPCVAPELRAHVRDTKLLSIILCVLFDDVADQHSDGRLLSALLEMASGGACRSWKSLSAVEKRHGGIARSVWATYWARIATYPCYSTFEPVLRYDLSQFFNTMRYSHLVNSRPYLLNMAEHDMYTPHNMMMVSFATLDLMCSPGFARAEVGPLREAVWHAQCMGRIGNLLSTWKREMADRDFTSGVFARALVAGDVTLAELEHGDATDLEAVIRDGDHEAHFFQQWFEHRRCCHALARRIRSVDLAPVLEGHDRFFAMHLGSRGLI